MSSVYQGNGHNGSSSPSEGGTAVQDLVQSPPETLVASAVGDRCVNCGATLQSDQRYCVICGERRGAPRFALPAAGAPPTEVTTTTISSGGSSRGPRFGAGTTLVAGVGTLLLALLVGFLIGHAAGSNTTKTVAAKAPAVTVVNTGGGTSSGSSSGATTPSSTSTTPSSSKTKASKTTKAAAKKTSNAESNAAAKATGGSGTPPANTKVGQKCSGSACNKAGYNKKTHKFDGSFFGQ